MIHCYEDSSNGFFRNFCAGSAAWLEREVGVGQNQSARGQAHSKKLARGRQTLGAIRKLLECAWLLALFASRPVAP